MTELAVDETHCGRIDAVVGSKEKPIALHCVVRTRAPRLKGMARSFMANVQAIFGSKHQVQIRATFYSDLSDSCNIFVTEKGTYAWDHAHQGQPDVVFDATLKLHQACVEEYVVLPTRGFSEVRRSFTHDVCYADGVATHWEGT